LVKIKNKFEALSAPSLFNLEQEFRQFLLKMRQDPEIWINELEDYRMRIEELGSSISDNQFIPQILNNMMDDYNSQLAMIKKIILK
jgi:hypothetical protein